MMRFAITISLFFFISGVGILFAQTTESSGSIESEAETISKCLRDLQSGDVEVRRRAVLILGKYHNPSAVSAVIASLSDTEASIRRSALVSLTERSPLPPAASVPILRLMGDPDVHIRRISTSYLPEVIRSYNVRSRVISEPGFNRFPPELEIIIREAFTDADATVRKNMMTNYRFFQEILPANELKKLILDDDPEVRIMALNVSVNVLASADLIEVARKLRHDSDPLIRLQLAEALSRYSTPEAKQILLDLAKDKDFDVSTKAFVTLFQTYGMEYYAELSQRFGDPRIDVDVVKQVISRLPAMGQAGASALTRLLDDHNITIREYALNTYGRFFSQQLSFDLIRRHLDDPSQSIRDAASRLLLRTPNAATDSLDQLLSSPYPDIRELLVTVSRRLSDDDASDLLYDLMLDDQIAVRIAAISEIYRRKLDGWEDILRRTLEDNDPEIRFKLVEKMLRLGIRDSTVHGILTDFAGRTADDNLRRMILVRLTGRRQIPTNMSH